MNSSMPPAPHRLDETAGQRLGFTRLVGRLPRPLHKLAHHRRFIGDQHVGDALA
jgi:hypothetical protein